MTATRFNNVPTAYTMFILFYYLILRCLIENYNNNNMFHKNKNVKKAIKLIYYT